MWCETHPNSLPNVSALIYNKVMNELPANWRKMSEAEKDAFLMSYHTGKIGCNCTTCINERETNAKLGI